VPAAFATFRRFGLFLAGFGLSGPKARDGACTKIENSTIAVRYSIDQTKKKPPEGGFFMLLLSFPCGKLQGSGA
jgi:hypothetical protein